ncbi:MAG TPA: DUF58 domain-containing protein [Bdellovibrionales bacterium]|nr:DUF58 domain-containing protein [Bdellovibrionales bacterium]
MPVRLPRWVYRDNRIYIMPSGRGFIFLSMVVVLILTAATYNNNLIFILAFFLFAVFVVTMLQTHYNLKGVRLYFVAAGENYAGEFVPFTFRFHQARARLKRDLKIRAYAKYFSTPKPVTETVNPEEAAKTARVEVLSHKRGVFPLPTVVLETFYPLGLFRAWKVFRFEGKVTVYPKPLDAPMLEPARQESGEDEQGRRGSPEGDFGELKNYLPGESYHQIAWKQYARTGQLYSKVHWGAERKHYQVPWRGGRDLEAELARMAGWIKTAMNEGASFEMQTPDLTIATGAGPDHARRCLRALAAVAETA